MELLKAKKTFIQSKGEKEHCQAVDCGTMITFIEPVNERHRNSLQKINRVISLLPKNMEVVKTGYEFGFECHIQ
jgi:CRISPR/Cas system CSM-associated protein Csm3 (group 7 of RAMP superfamily)